MPPSTHKPAVPVIGILGMSYCGSTMVTNVLDTIPGIYGLGETHWIRDRPKMKVGCVTCRHDGQCSIITPDLIDELRANPMPPWWPTIIRHLPNDARALVTSDKAPSNYKKLGEPDIYLFMWKDPRSHIFSKIRNDRIRDGEIDRDTPHTLPLPEDRLHRDGIDWFARNVRVWLRFIQETYKPVVGVNLHELALHPVTHFWQMLANLELNTPIEAVRLATKLFWSHKHHAIGGNSAVYYCHDEKSYYFAKTIRPDEKWKVQGHEQYSELVLNNPNIRRWHNAVESIKTTPFFDPSLLY